VTKPSRGVRLPAAAPGTRGRRRPGLAPLLVLLACVACLPDPERLIAQGRIDDAISAIRSSPDSYKTRYMLARAHLAGAQRALQAGDATAYADRIAESRREARRAVELAPLEPAGHNLLGMLAAYERDVTGARRSFEIARELDPEEPIFYLNLAELEICRGEFAQGESLLASARQHGATAALADLSEALAVWRRGDAPAARAIVERVIRTDPDTARMWAGGSPIVTFEDFTRYCSRLPFCDQSVRR
jgi:Flp pilus assembly protein TadD